MSFLQDVRLAVRLFPRTPALTGIALLSIALSVAATAVVFTAVKAVLMNPLPYARPGELVQFRSTDNVVNSPNPIPTGFSGGTHRRSSGVRVHSGQLEFTAMSCSILLAIQAVRRRPCTVFACRRACSRHLGFRQCLGAIFVRKRIVPGNRKK